MATVGICKGEGGILRSRGAFCDGERGFRGWIWHFARVRGIVKATRGDFSWDGQFEMVRAKFEGGRGFPCAASCFQPVGRCVAFHIGCFWEMWAKG